MQRVVGLLDIIPQLSSVKPEQLSNYSKKDPSSEILANNLNNRILYSGAVPFTSQELESDLTILHQAIASNPGGFYNANLRSIYIPEKLLNFFPDLTILAWVFIDAVNPKGITQIILKSETLGLKSLGSLIRPELKSSSGAIRILVEGKNYEVKIGTRVSLPGDSNKIDIKFEPDKAAVLGKELTSLEVSGGKLGLLIDAR